MNKKSSACLFQIIFIIALFGIGPITAHASCTPGSLKVSVRVDPNILWPPNHEYVTVEPVVTVSGACGSYSVELYSVESNEPDNGIGDGDHAEDIVIVDDMMIQLRAERSGRGDGRMYTITYMATENGFKATGSAVVAVPFSQDFIR